MITRIVIKFKYDVDVRPNSTLATLFQGVLMECITDDFADKMHISSIHPYSQFISSCDGCVLWTVTALNIEARKNIIDVLASDSFVSVEIKHKNITLDVEEKNIYEISYNQLLDKYYLCGKSCRYITLNLFTQTAFKSNGKYIIMPDSKLIFNNLVRKYDSVSDNTEIFDDTLAEYIKNHTEIVEYNLKSRKFAMEGITIPSFSGIIKIKLSGNTEFICLCNMLLDFAQYSGIGIKTAMGMGASIITNTGGAI